MTNNTRFRNNPQLKTIKSPTGWKGTPVDEKGRFLNLVHPFIPNWVDVFRWKFQKSPFRKDKKTEQWKPAVLKDDSWIEHTDDIMVWFGHSSFYIRIGGVRLLIDPVFWGIPFIKRHSPLPIDVHRLINLDYILLSHDHRDHLDKKSLEMLSKYNPQVRYLTGLGMKEIVNSFTRSHKIEEAGWYQQYNISHQGMNVTFIPARHWAKRGLNDTNKRLWGGFAIETAGKRILFGGDSGYGSHYRQLAEVFGGFDYAILGIGAYEPAWFMGPNHQSPAEALKAFTDLNAEYLIPMHYGTFDLSDEPLSQPLKDLKSVAKETKLEEKLAILTIGQKKILL